MLDEVVWVFGDLAVSSLPLVLWMTASVGMVLLVGVGQLMRKGRRSGLIAGDELAEPEPPDSDATDAPHTIDLRLRGAPTSDRKAFQDGLTSITRSLHLSSVYQMPWFLVLGQALGGKTTALASSTLDNPLGAPDDVRSGLQWWSFDRAQLLDIPGSYVLDPSTTTSDRSAWFGLLALLRRTRRRRPADSVILVIPATELVDFDTTDEAAQRNLLRRSEFLRRKLWQAQERLGMRLPVYVVVTQSDRVVGYDAFFQSVPQATRRQILGWSNPNDTGTEYSPSWVEDAFGSLDTALARHEDRLVSSEPAARGPDPLDVLSFRRQIARLQDPVQLALDQIFVSGALYEPFPLRGLYFTGGTGFTRGAYHAEENAHPTVSFIDDLLSWKVFYEWSLGRATRAARERANRRRGLFSVLFAFLAIAGPALVFWGQVNTSRRAVEVDRQFYSPIETNLPQTTSSGARRLAESLLRAGSSIESYHLQTILLPTSYVSSFRTTADQAGERAMREIILPGIREEFDADLAVARSELQRRSDPRAVITNMESTVEYQSLASAERRLELVETGADDYNCIVQPCSTDGQHLRQYLSSLAFKAFGIDWQPPSYGARNYYTGLLRHASLNAPPQRQATPRYQPCHDTANSLGNELSSTTVRMFDALFGPNQLINADLSALQSGIDNLVKEPRPPAAARAAFEQMIEAIDKVEQHLSRPDVAWAGHRTMTLGPRYSRLQEYFSASCFMGQQASVRRTRVDATDQYGQNRYVDFRRGLGAFATQTTGPLLKRNDLGEPLLLLSDGVLDLQAILKNYLSQQTIAPSVLEIPEVDQTVAWDAVELERAKALLSRFDGFIDQQADVDVDTFDLISMLRPDVNDQVLSRVAKAQTVSPRPRLREDRELQRAGLRTEVENLTSVSSDLTAILGGLAGPSGATPDCVGNTSPFCRLAHTLEVQKFNLLTVTTDLLDEEAPYQPQVTPHELLVPGDTDDWLFLSTWDGRSNPAFLAFGVDNSTDLEIYVDRQLEIIKEFDNNLAGPTIREAVPSTPNSWGFHDQIPYRIWDEASEELTKLTDKTPGNSPTALDQFILGTMATVRVDSCADAGFATNLACPLPSQTFVEMCDRCDCDIFQARRRQLEAGLGERCNELAVLDGIDAWRALRDAFENRLEGKYPFVASSPPPGVDEVLLDDLASFLNAYSPRRAAIEGMLTVASRCPGGVDAALEPAADFLTSFDEVKSFFASWLELRAKAPTTAPSFGLQLEFRTNRRNERGAQYILRWSFDVGLDTVAIVPGTVDVQPLWTYGEPVSLALRWALDAPVRPIQPTEEPFAVLDGLSVQFDYTNAWSLLRLIEDHPTPVDFQPAGSSGTVPETLQFEVPTVERTDATTDTGKVTEFDPVFSRVYVRLTLTQPGDREQELAVPTFPATVPALPEALLDDTSGDLCRVLGAES